MDFAQSTLKTESFLDLFLLCFTCFKILQIQGKLPTCHLASSWFKHNLPYRMCHTDCLFLLLSYTWSLAYIVQCSAVDTLTHCLVWLTIGGPIDPQTLSGLVDTRWRRSILDGAGLQVGSPPWAPHQNVWGASGIQGHTGCLRSFVKFCRRSLGEP